MSRIPIAGPWITQKEIDYVTEAVTSAWYADANKFHGRFERAFATHCGRKHAVSLPSCTSGLHLALLALGIGRGDEVIVPDATWIASVAPVTYVGATPIFADIDVRSWCLCPDAFESLITPRTKAAIVVDLYGSMPDWDRLAEIGERRGVALIEDAAEAVGSCWRERPAGSFGVMSAFLISVGSENTDDRRRRDAGSRRRWAARPGVAAARSWPGARRHHVLQRGGRVEVQDVVDAGRARPRAARAYR